MVWKCIMPILVGILITPATASARDLIHITYTYAYANTQINVVGQSFYQTCFPLVVTQLAGDGWDAGEQA